MSNYETKIYSIMPSLIKAAAEAMGEVAEIEERLEDADPLVRADWRRHLLEHRCMYAVRYGGVHTMNAPYGFSHSEPKRGEKMREDILTIEERGGLTIHGENISAQIRWEQDLDGTTRRKLVLHVLEDTNPEIVQGDLLIGENDVAKLRELLNEAASRERASR